MPFKWKRKGRKTCKTVKLFNYKCLNFNDKNGWACEMLPTKNRPSTFIEVLKINAPSIVIKKINLKMPDNILKKLMKYF